jgi:hypothetical protein
MGHKGQKRKRYGQGKPRSIVKHFRKRMLERFDEELSYDDIQFITNMIRNGDTIRSRKQTNRVTEHVIRFNNKKMKVIYDKQRKLPITCLYVSEDY